MQNTIPKLEEYGMSPEYGFLPLEMPLTILSNPYFSTWEAIIKHLPQLISKRRIREMVNKLPVLSTSKLKSESEWQRAYTMLCFIAHGYIWGEYPVAESLPDSLSLPLLEVCASLGTLPVITYAALCLWNFQLLEGQCLDIPENLVALHTFTGTTDESWFYIISVAIEARGAPLIPILLKAMGDVRKEDSTALTEGLSEVASILAGLSPILHRMYDHLSPEVFYKDIRPFLAGTINLPKGILFHDSSGKEGHLQYRGGSAAQSSLFQFCDIVLGVQHTSLEKDTDKYLEDTRNYMPGCHRRFLQDVSLVANIKTYLEAHNTDSALAATYTRCLQTLREFRSLHIGIVSRYIVIPAKIAARNASGDNFASVSSTTEANIMGTGGTQVITFLKQVRDDTK